MGAKFTGGSSGGGGNGKTTAAILSAIAGLSLARIVEKFLLGLPVARSGFGVANIIGSITGMVAAGIDSLRAAAISLNQAFIIAPARGMGQQWEYAAYSITRGEWAFIGPFSPLAYGLLLIGSATMLIRWYDRNDWDTLGVDVPGIGIDEAGGDEEDT